MKRSSKMKSGYPDIQFIATLGHKNSLSRPKVRGYSLAPRGSSQAKPAIVKLFMVGNAQKLLC
jgi:hypothetical protein